MTSANFQNQTLYHGDNLPFMMGMNDNCVDLIATDPPPFKGKVFHADPRSLAHGAQFQDRWSWEKNVDPEWIDQIKESRPHLMKAIETAKHVHSDGMGAFLCFLSVRLLEMHRILKDTGSVYLHCSATASHYIKMVMDGIFGHRRFRNEIVWCYSIGGTPNADFPSKHDYILRYVKTDKWFFRQEYKVYVRNVQAVRRHEKLSDGNLDFGRSPVPSWWNDINPLTGRSAEKIGYPTQKPLALYQRIIAASSNKGDIVLDPFCGCATTLVAAERLDRRWVGIDLWAGDNTAKMVKRRMEYESSNLFKSGNVQLIQEPPERTASGSNTFLN